MKKYLQIGLAASFLIGLLTLVACKDDEPPTPSELSFAVSSMTVNEADDILEIEIVLDKPALEDFTVEYELEGTAQDEETESDETPSADYYIIDDENDYGEVDFEKGQSVGIIKIQLYSDLLFEDDETIEISLTDVDSDLVELTRDDDIEITIEQEDGLVVALDWEEEDVDLDLLIRIGENTTTWDGILTGSLFNQPEIAFLPQIIEDAAFGLSYTYYSGEVEPLDFVAIFIEFENGVLEPVAERESFEGQYTLVNVNRWDDDDKGIATTQVVQTFEKVGTTWTNFSDISIPDEGSRVGFQNLSSLPLKIKGIKSGKKVSHKQ